VRGKMPSDTFPSLIHYMTLNLNISTSRQNIKNLVGKFGGIHVKICIPNFKPLASMAREENEGRKDRQQFLP